MRIEVIRGGLTGAAATVAGGRSTTGGRTTGTIWVIRSMRLEPAPGAPVSTPPTTPPRVAGPLTMVSGGSTIMAAIAGIWAGDGSMTRLVYAGLAAALRGTGSTLGPGGTGAVGTPGSTSPVTKNARPRVCGDSSGAKSAQPISTACPVNPMAVVQT